MKLGIVYHSDFLLHDKAGHPENKGRLKHIINILEKNNLFLCVEKIKPISAKISEVALVHDKTYINDLKKKVESGCENLDMDTYLTTHSFDVALLSSGSALTAMRETIKNNRVCFSLGRPPGHHAEADKGMGFCLFNNIAIAAKVAIKEFDLKRILIIDFDVHHGNGTQNTFYNDNKVFFISIHQSPAYPGTGDSEEKGEGFGAGYNLNIPMPPNCGDLEYEEAFKNIIEPVVNDYKPELLLISAGFDAYFQDPLANMNLTEKGYKMMSIYIKKMADKHCNGKAVFCLEGGYHLEGQAKVFLETLAVFINLSLAGDNNE